MFKGIIKFISEFDKLAKVYFLIAILWGLVMVFLIPPFRSPDETGHYYRASALSEGKIFCDSENNLEINEDKYLFSEMFDASNQGNYRCVDLGTGVIDEEYDATRRDGLSKIQFFPKMPNELNKRVSKKSYKVESRLCASWPVSHVAPASGIWLGNKIGLSEFWSFYAGRIANLTVGVFLVAISIAMIPFGKRILFALGLLPMTIYLFSSIHYDGLAIPVVFIFISYVMFLREKSNRLSTHNYLIMFVLALLVTLIKPYHLLLVLMFLIPTKSNKNIKGVLVVFLATLLLGLVAYKTRFIIFNAKLPYVPEWVNRDAQLNLILSKPLGFVGVVLLNSIVFSVRLYIPGFIGQIGWHEYLLRPATYVLAIFLLIAFVSNGRKKEVFLRKEKVLLISVFVVIYFLTFLSAYIGFSPVGSSLVLGVYGRYFIPIAVLPMLVFALRSHSADGIQLSRRVNLVLLILFVVMVLDFVLTTYFIYYKNSWPFLTC